MCDTATFKGGRLPCSGVWFITTSLRIFSVHKLAFIFPVSNLAGRPIHSAIGATGSEDRCKTRIGDGIAPQASDYVSVTR